MKTIAFNFGRKQIAVDVPEESSVFGMQPVTPLDSPEDKIRAALENPDGTPPLSRIVRDKLQANPRPKAVVVISDDTRPVPYRGPEGILFPVIDILTGAGIKPENIRILVATGTHLPMSEPELGRILDPRVMSLGIPILNHDCRDITSMTTVGRTDLAGEVRINSTYMESDIKILTGLVESHFMAGASGGRKSLCPGLMGENTTAVIHGGAILQSPMAADLVLKGNPVHEETLKVARMAGCDFIVNATLDSRYRLSGVFAGDLEQAHLRAVEKIKAYVGFTANGEYDLVISHGGYVGTNHYQTAKAAVICSSMLKKEGFCVLASDHSVSEPIGGENYRSMLRLLGELGAEKYENTITGIDWTFVPEQWQPQMWARLFRKIPPESLYYCSLEIPAEDFAWIPGLDARTLCPGTIDLAELTQAAVESARRTLRSRLGREPEIAVLKDGPYAIPIR